MLWNVSFLNEEIQGLHFFPAQVHSFWTKKRREKNENWDKIWNQGLPHQEKAFLYKANDKFKILLLLGPLPNISSEKLSAHYCPGLRFGWFQTLKVPTHIPLFKFPWLSNQTSAIV